MNFLTYPHQSNILMCAHSKTGQHWIVFIVANYQRLINNNPVITWKEILEYSRMRDSVSKCAHCMKYTSELVNFVRIEYPYTHNKTIKQFVDSFDKKIYLYRNPYDVMISMFYYFHTEPVLIKKIQEKKDFKGWDFFEDYVKSKIGLYISHILKSVDYVDLVLYYDDLLKDTTPFRTILSYFYDELNEEIYQKTLEVSSFEHVNKMEKEIKEERWKKYPWKRELEMRFHARDGRSGQYHELMSIELIDYISEKWEDLKKKVKYKLK